MQPSAQNKTPILQHRSDGMMLGQYDQLDYDTVGGILSNGDKHQGMLLLVMKTFLLLCYGVNEKVLKGFT